MKWFEIFGRKPPREDAFPDLGVEVPKNEGARELPPFSDRSRKPSDAEKATASAFEPPLPALPADYFYPDAQESARLHAELLSALSDDHALFSVPLATFAAREGSGDVLFRFRGNPQRYALVRRAKSEEVETKNGHSQVLFSGTFAEFLAREKEFRGLEPPTETEAE